MGLWRRLIAKWIHPAAEAPEGRLRWKEVFQAGYRGGYEAAKELEALDCVEAGGRYQTTILSLEREVLGLKQNLELRDRQLKEYREMHRKMLVSRNLFEQQIQDEQLEYNG